MYVPESATDYEYEGQEVRRGDFNSSLAYGSCRVSVTLK